MTKVNLIQRSKSALCLISVFVLSSCTTLGPEFEEPEISWLNEWQSGSISQSESSDFDAAIVQSWWGQFDDPVLVSLIQAAQKDNLSLRIAGLRILESRAVQGLVGSSLLPQLQQVSGASDVVTTRQSGGGNTNQVATQFQGVLGWELDFWGRFQRAVESADASFFASVSQQRDLQVLIAAQMARLYFSYKVTERRIVITRFNASIQQRSFEITQERFTEGDESELDFQQARTQYLATLSVIPQLELSLRNTRNAICILLGKPPESIPELAESPFELPIVDPATISDFPAELLTLRPDVRVAAWQVAAQSAQIG
ncbi:TolC family protein, partial [Planctomycetota bacterium]|nr:TolC family protein [Planctomycetota bacterium]